MQLIKGKEQFAQICFYIGITLELIVMAAAQTWIVLPYASRFQHLAFVFFGLKILGTYYTKIEWIAILLFGMLGGVSYLAIGDEKAICVIIMILASKQIKVRVVAKYIFWFMMVTCVFIIFMALFGVGQPLLDTRSYGRGSIESRWGFGLGHANNMHGMAWYLITLLIWVYHDVLKKKHYVYLTIFNSMLFVATASRTGFLLTQAMIIGGWLLCCNVKWIQQKYVHIISYLCVIGLTSLTILAGLYGTVSNPIMAFFNTVLSGRLEYFRWYAGMETWKILYAQGTTGLIDNGIAKLFASHGYLVTSVYLLLTLCFIAYTKKKDAKYYMLLLFVLMTNFCYGFMEATFTFNGYLLINLFYVVLINEWHHLLPQKEKS